MAGQRSREDLKAFLDWVGAKGLMPLATVHARKAAVNNILEILSEEEASDVTLINIDELMSRYSNLKGKNYTPDSLKTYQSRLSKALEDFEIYVENPMGFRPSGGKRKISTAGKESVKLEKNRPNVASPPIGVSTPSVPPPSANIIPIAIRQDLIIHVQGIPFDLTKAEAQRVANVILAMAMETS